MLLPFFAKFYPFWSTGIMTHGFRKNVKRKYLAIMIRWPGTKVPLQTNWPFGKDRASKYTFLVDPLNQNYGQSIYFHCSKNLLVSLLLIPNAFTAIFSFSGRACLLVGECAGPSSSQMLTQSRAWNSEDCFFFPAGNSLKDSSLHTIPPQHASAEIFKWQISKKYHGMFPKLQSI